MKNRKEIFLRQQNFKTGCSKCVTIKNVEKCFINTKRTRGFLWIQINEKIDDVLFILSLNNDKRKMDITKNERKCSIIWFSVSQFVRALFFIMFSRNVC